MGNSHTNKKVAIYIDGSNFYKYLHNKKTGFSKGTRFNYNKFIKHLCRGRQCVFKGYYVGIVRNVDDTPKSKKLVRSQQKFLAGLETDGFTIGRGRIMYDKGEIREKGTDVKIAVDMIVGAIDKLYDTAILVSSDTDLIPAIRYIKSRRKNLEYVGFSHAPSFGIQKNANLSILLLPEDIDNFK